MSPVYVSGRCSGVGVHTVITEHVEKSEYPLPQYWN